MKSLLLIPVAIISTATMVDTPRQQPNPIAVQYQLILDDKIVDSIKIQSHNKIGLIELRYNYLYKDTL